MTNQCARIYVAAHNSQIQGLSLPKGGFLPVHIREYKSE